MACQFSDDGKYFAELTSEGKIKIWNTLSSTFQQEFTPNFNLTSPCSCLHFISDTASKVGSPRKKKRRDSVAESNTRLALGTTSGRLIVYSLTKGGLDYVIDSATSQSINCLSSNHDELVYSGTDTNIMVWNLYKRNVSSKWGVGNEKVVAILVIPGNDQLLTASKSIKLWNIKSKEVLRTYTGHSSPVTLLHYISPKSVGTAAFVISGSKGDRLLNCWNLSQNVDEKNAAASFLMEDIVNNLSVYTAIDGSTNISATVRNGVVHVYQHTFNGRKSTKPVKPKTTIQVVSDSKDDQVVSPIFISAAQYRDSETLCICYGTAIVHTFEDIVISNYKKLQCLLREDITKKGTDKENQVSKIRTPVVDNDVHYLSSQTSAANTKRKNDGQQEIPMEKRLENLMVNEIASNNTVPKANNIAQLLVQGLHSKDKNILRTVLYKKDEEFIKNTLRRVPVTLIKALFQELTKMIQGKTMARLIGLIWLKNLIQIHSGFLLSNPDLSTLFSEALGSIEAGLALQVPRSRLMGRLDLLVSQINKAPPRESQEGEPMLVYNDKEASDSDNDGMEFDDHSSSDNEWEEENSDVAEGETEKDYESDNEIVIESDEVMSS